MQKVINLLAIASTVVSAAVVGTGAYVYLNRASIIEGVKDMPLEQQKTSLHRKNHVLMVCYHYNWHELEYIKNRRESADVQMYKSQENRYVDVQ